MSYYTSSVLPFESRQYWCEQHPLYEDPFRCSTCECNRHQRQRDRERGERARSVIEQATRDHGSSSTYRDLQQDLARYRSNNYGELRSSARDPLYGASSSASESYYRSYDSRGVRDTELGSPHRARSTSFRDPFERSRYADSNQYGDLRWDNSASSNLTTSRYADRPPPDHRDLDSMRSSSRRNGLSGNSGGGWHLSQCPQQ